ncbi:MAG: hypothetical protein ABH824_02855 [Nanoarchaeota archaeon]|nr:ATP-binding protein [Nanoarchaeota archaeon]MBU1632083.1 ATP-binding protein [Nanoarchaeota archaeon]MBU1875717.1 ATP-binding protein [Nanoarchaeota archaeon]
MLLNNEFTLENALKIIAPYKLIKQIKIIPAKNGKLQESSTGQLYWRESPELNDFIFKRLKISARKNTQIWDAISLGLENAFWRGNKNNPQLEVIVRIFLGKNGKIIQIKDSGNGFDYVKKIKLLKSGGNYASGLGRGLKALNKVDSISAGYQGKGNILNIVVRSE